MKKTVGKLLFDCLMHGIVENINFLTTNSKLEKRQLLWSTYNNINTWFKLLNKELIKLGFARSATAE